jgi:hypothetical protein
VKSFLIDRQRHVARAFSHRPTHNHAAIPPTSKKREGLQVDWPAWYPNKKEMLREVNEADAAIIIVL